MGYGIFRVEKLKKISNLRGSLMHAFREQDTPNADPERRKENVLLTLDANSVQSTLAKYERLKPTGKIRSDVVHAIEVLVTASPEDMKKMSREEREGYLRKSLDFCNTEFGEGNLLHAQIHNDETTAHLTAFYIPVIEKQNKKGQIVRKLNASDILGGKKEYSNRQTKFYEQVSKHYGLERGEIGSKATHKKVLDWYSEINSEAVRLDLDGFMRELEGKAFSAVKVNVEKTGVLGFGSKTVEEEVKLPAPSLGLPDIKNVLRLQINGNSEIKRREKKAIKKEARKEVEEELKWKWDEIERAVQETAFELHMAEEARSKADMLEAENNKFISRRNAFYVELKKIFSISEKTYEKIEKLVLDGIKGFSNKIINLNNTINELKQQISSLLVENNLLKTEKQNISESLGNARARASLLDNELITANDKFEKLNNDFNDIDKVYNRLSELGREKKTELIERLESNLSFAGDHRNSTEFRINAWNSYNSTLRMFFAASLEDANKWYSEKGEWAENVENSVRQAINLMGHRRRM